MPMYHFGVRSREQMESGLLHEDMRAVLMRAMSLQVMDFSVLESHRTRERQNAAYDAGLSQKRWPDGKHNHMPSTAVDIAPYPIDWNDSERFALLAGVMLAAAKFAGIEIRWGGDWDSDRRTADEKFRDRGHFELI